jgi:hypothetical protein
MRLGTVLSFGLSRRGATLAAAGLAGALLVAGPLGAVQLIDEPEDMPEGPGRDTVFYVCSACHSMSLVVQQGLSRKRWDKLLDWMVEEQGMAELDAATRTEILDYLSTHYDEDRSN